MDYKVNDTIEYVDAEGLELVVVVYEKRVIDGQPGFEGLDPETDDGFWGYDSQIVRVVS